jgi:hypothetical protein
MNLEIFNNPFFRFYKIFFYFDIVKMELEYINKNLIDKKHLLKAKEISSQMHAFKLNIKREFSAKGIKYDEVFEDLSNEKIFAIMSVVNSMLLLDENQCLEFEKSLEIEEKN